MTNVTSFKEDYMEQITLYIFSCMPLCWVTFGIIYMSIWSDPTRM
jgi:hypothetical protein